MGSFSAVVTTGIYCRPGCPAKPNEKNVRSFAVAAAAEAAGFRACLRCRPYRSGMPLSVSGPDLVCRAVRLVVDGALDGATEADLCAQLGVSSRHLRRLFAEHVGVTPDQLARSRRAHFARRLLDDTDLSVTDIAFASGFGSVRQMNRACLDVFRASPTELRARRRRSDRLAADGGLALRLPYEGALDWEAALSYFAGRAIPGVEAVDRVAGIYRRTVVVDGEPGVLELAEGGPGELVLTAHLPYWEGLIHVVQRARRIVSLDADTAGAESVLGDDEVVGPLLRKRPGLRPMGTWDPFETGVRAIVGQQVSVAGATTISGRIAETYGSLVPGLEDMGLRRLFPTPEVLAGAELTSVGLPEARAIAVSSFAQAVAEGSVVLERGAVAYPELVRSLCEVRGVGPWTAEYLALRMGEADAFPATDLVLDRALKAAGLRPGDAERWRPFRAHAAVQLWNS